MKKIAFCFLLYDTIQHLQIWEEFFDQDTKNKHSIYSHLKTVSKDTPKWIKKVKVRSVKTDWCGEGLIHAFSQMLKKALLNNDNQFFVLLSGSCIPLYSFSETYRKCSSSAKSKISFQKEDGNVFEERNDIYNAHQWVILNRKVAKDYIRLSDRKDTKAKTFLKLMRTHYKNSGVKVGNFKAIMEEDEPTWLGGCPDEIYPINWFKTLYKKNFSKYIRNQMTTYSSWDFEKDPQHPETFNKNTIKRAKKEICGRGHIFARKFTSEAANYIAMNCGKKKSKV